MKKKNLLAENMLRFKAKNLSETAKQNIVELARIITEQDIDPGDVIQNKRQVFNHGLSGDNLSTLFPGVALKDIEISDAYIFYKGSETDPKYGTSGSVTGKFTVTGRYGRENTPFKLRVIFTPTQNGSTITIAKLQGSDAFLKAMSTKGFLNNKGQKTATANEYYRSGSKTLFNLSDQVDKIATKLTGRGY